MLDQILNSSLSKELIVVIIAAIPVVELRGSLPIAMQVFQLPWYQAFYLSIIGNLLPVPFILLFFSYAARILQKTGPGKRLLDWLYLRAWNRTRGIEKYKRLGLIFFVAVPLPFTGAWTASLIAYVLGMKTGKAFLDIFIGVVCAGIIVSALIFLGWIGAAIAIVALIVLLVIGAWKM